MRTTTATSPCIILAILLTACGGATSAQPIVTAQPEPPAVDTAPVVSEVSGSEQQSSYGVEVSGSVMGRPFTAVSALVIDFGGNPSTRTIRFYDRAHDCESGSVFRMVDGTRYVDVRVPWTAGTQTLLGTTASVQGNDDARGYGGAGTIELSAAPNRSGTTTHLRVHVAAIDGEANQSVSIDGAADAGVCITWE